MRNATEMLRGGLHRLPAFILKAFGFYIAVTLACVVLVAPFADYSCGRSDIVSYGIPLFLLSLLACSVVVVLFSYVRSKTSQLNHFNLFVLGMGLALLAAQLYFEKSAGFITGWDVSVLSQVGDRAPVDTESLSYYFSVYPNQILLYGLFYKLASVASLLGLSSYRALVYGSCFCVTASIVLATFVCRRLFGDVRALTFQVLASLFIGLNGWVLVPYSDTYGMLFTCTALWFYVIPRRRSVRLLGVTAVSLLGYMVKPTAVFLLFAIVCLDWIPATVRGFSRTSVRDLLLKALPVAVPVVFGIVLALGAGQLVKGNYFTINENASYGMTHFLAMGINPERKGVYSLEENELSGSIADPDERRAAQLALWKEHLSELGPIGVAKIWFQKNLTNYADGTFAWKMEGGFIQEITGDSPAVKSWLGLAADGEAGSSSTAYGWCCQILWIAVLIGCAVSARRRARYLGMSGPNETMRSTNHVCAVIALALVFLSGFLLIFECRARYLFLFSPFYVLLAIDGLVGRGSTGELLARKVAASCEDRSRL